MKLKYKFVAVLEEHKVVTEVIPRAFRSKLSIRSPVPTVYKGAPYYVSCDVFKYQERTTLIRWFENLGYNHKAMLSYGRVLLPYKLFSAELVLICGE